jgi:hypothetical protein
VVVRCRPMSDKEQENNCERFLLFNSYKKSIHSSIQSELWILMDNVDKYPSDVRRMNLLNVMPVMMDIISFSMLFMTGSMLFILNV